MQTTINKLKHGELSLHSKSRKFKREENKKMAFSMWCITNLVNPLKNKTQKRIL
jgi:hypothetical protein